MHDVVFYVGLVWILALLVTTLIAVIRADGTMSRILALDALTLVLTALLILYSASTGRSYYVDAALMLALVSFMSTVAAARYYSEDRLA